MVTVDSMRLARISPLVFNSMYQCKIAEYRDRFAVEMDLSALISCDEERHELFE